ncbi:MAG: hypothetical protein ACR2OV_15800 [Hyphomicrobiaceae bacterium]
MDTNAGLFLGGVARQRNTNRELGLRDRAIGVQENQLELQRRTDMRNQVMEAIGKTTDQAVSLVEGASSREAPGFSSTLGQIRANVETLARQAEQAGVGITAQSVLSTFDNAVLSSQTAGEKAETEAQAAVAGAASTVEGISTLPASQQAQVGQLLGLTEPRQTQEFFGLLEILEDPNASELAKELASDRINAISQNSSGQLTISTSPDGSVTVTQGQGIPSRTQIGGTRLDQLRADLSLLDRTSSILDQLIENPPPLGALGALRAGTQTFSGVIADVTGVPLNDALEELRARFAADPGAAEAMATVGEIDVAEGLLTYALARTLQPEGRLLASTVQAARAQTNLTGFASQDQVLDRLRTIKQQIDSTTADLQQRVQQGTQGTTDVPDEPVTLGGETPEASDLLDRIDSLLGGSGG